MFEKSKWIWTENNYKKDDRILIRHKFSVEKPPKEIFINIGASDYYNMYINGKPVIINGGLSRIESKSGYYDTVNISKLINKGDNVIGFKCHYVGEDFCGSKTCGAAGLIVECQALNIYSGSSFKAYRPDGFTSCTDNNNCAYAAAKLCYDAGKGGDIVKVFDVTYSSTLLESGAVEYGDYGVQPFGELTERSIPNLLFGNVEKAKITNKSVVGANTVYTANIGEATIFAPIVEATALGAEKITIVSDRGISDGSWGDTEKYSGGYIEYVCKNGLQNYESEVLLSGTALTVTMPSSVKLGYIGFRTVYYDTDTVGSFKCGDERVDILFDKCVNTLDSCINTGFWDSPDRLRGSNLSALSAGGRAALYLYDDNILPLIKKSITDFMSGESIKNNAISNKPFERVFDSLLVLGNLGIIASYYNRTGDGELVKQFYKKAAEYLLDWQMQEDGKIVLREGDCDFIDSGYNIDKEVILTALYFSACKFIGSSAKMFGDEVIFAKLDERSTAIAENFDSAYFDGTGYKSGDFYDDRANALVILSGLNLPNDEKNNDGLIKILTSVKNASVLTEAYVLEALASIGAENLAKTRMLDQLTSFADSVNPTMSECFNDSGALCYSGSVGLINFLFSSIAGIKFDAGERITITPKLATFEELKYTVPVKGGDISGLYRNSSKNDIIIENNSLLKVTLTIGDKIAALNKGKNKC